MWKPEVGDGATIMMRTGDVPKSRFYTDSIMVASEHAMIVFEDEQPMLKCNARHCFTFIRRDGDIHTSPYNIQKSQRCCRCMRAMKS